MEHSFEAHMQILEEHLRRATASDRRQVYPQLKRMLDGFERRGGTPPSRLSRIRAELADEAFESAFDNIPV